jgi:2'-hydroxyisoflavone reductase
VVGGGLTTSFQRSVAYRRGATLRTTVPASRPLRILILGGTGFIGPPQVRYALARGHTVTLFNRGETDPELFPMVERLRGDRAAVPGDYAALQGREWDAVIDNPTRRPRWAREAAAALAGHVAQYLFISTISVYAANDRPGADETAAVQTTDTPDVERSPNFAALYGPLKALAEGEIQRAFPGRATIIRPGLVVGVGDPTDRFTYWPVRIARGGEVLAPPADDPVQFIDARDLAEWTIRCCENTTVGVFNATGPAARFTVQQMVEGARAVLDAPATFTYVPADFLAAHNVTPWSDLPVWVPAEVDSAGFTTRNISAAIARGLTFRPFAETVRETLAFYHSRAPDQQAALRAGLSAERERAVLDHWDGR